MCVCVCLSACLSIPVSLSVCVCLSVGPTCLSYCTCTTNVHRCKTCTVFVIPLLDRLPGISSTRRHPNPLHYVPTVIDTLQLLPGTCEKDQNASKRTQISGILVFLLCISFYVLSRGAVPCSCSSNGLGFPWFYCRPLLRDTFNNRHVLHSAVQSGAEHTSLRFSPYLAVFCVWTLFLWDHRAAPLYSNINIYIYIYAI